MKTLLLILLIILPTATAGTYPLGSHQVSFDVSEPYNSSAKIDPPTHVPEGESWMYNLEMTPDEEHIIQITVVELPSTRSSDQWLKSVINSKLQQVQEIGIGGHKYSTMDFRGYPAYQESFPAQIVSTTNGSAQYPASHALMYAFDERTAVAIVAMGDEVDTPYQEILDTIEVADAPKKPTKYAPYVG
jgi:hypothetical protein